MRGSFLWGSMHTALLMLRNECHQRFTSMGRSEILGLRWMHVDLGGSRLMLPPTKNGDGRIVHLNGYAGQAILSQWSEDARATGRVFRLADDCTPDNISKGFAGCGETRRHP